MSMVSVLPQRGQSETLEMPHYRGISCLSIYKRRQSMPYRYRGGRGYMTVQQEIEDWRDVIGYEGLYQVSNLGRVKSIDMLVNNGKTYYIKPGRLRKLVLNKKIGYLTVVLSKNGKHKTCYVHRLVAMAFCKGFYPGMLVNHINEVKTDNRSQNLEWCTKQYNNLYEDKPLRSAKPILQLSLEGATIAVWKSAREAASALNVEYKNISACCRKRRKSAGGFQWRFIDE